MIDAIVSGMFMIVLRTGYLLWVLTCIPDSAMSQAAGSRPRGAAINADNYLKGSGAGILAEFGVNAQPGDRPGNGAFNRAQADAEQRGDLRLGHVLEVPEHDGGAHPLRQPVEGVPDHL